MPSCEYVSTTKVNYIRVIVPNLGGIRLKMTNQKALPYNLANDLLRHKIELLIDNRPSYIPNISGDVYGNVGSVVRLASFETNEYGMVKWTYNTDDIPNRNINTGEFWATATYNGQNITSNRVRDNFLRYVPFVDIDQIIINAGTCDPIDFLNGSGLVVLDAYPDWVEIDGAYAYQDFGFDPFWYQTSPDSIFTQHKWVNEGSGSSFIESVSDSPNNETYQLISGEFRIYGRALIQADSSHGLYVEDGSFNRAAVKYNANTKMAAYYNGALITESDAGVVPVPPYPIYIDYRLSRFYSGVFVEEVAGSESGYFSAIHGGDPGPDPDTVMDLWIENKMIIGSGTNFTTVQSDVGDSGNLVDVLYVSGGLYDIADTFNRVQLYVPHNINDLYFDDIVLSQNSVVIDSGNFEDGTLGGYTNLGNSTVENVPDPVGISSGCLVRWGGGGDMLLEKELSPVLNRADGDIELSYKVYVPSSGYWSHSTSFTERNKSFLRIIPAEGYGTTVTYRPLSWVKFNTNTTDVRTFSLYVNSFGGSTMLWEYDVGPTGYWQELYQSGVPSLEDELYIGFDLGYDSSAGSGNAWSELLFEADAGLPNSGVPYETFNTWYYDNFDLNPWFSENFHNGFDVDISGGIAWDNGTANTGDALSLCASGDFIFDARVYTSGVLGSHGIRIVDGTGKYIELTGEDDTPDHLRGSFYDGTVIYRSEPIENVSWELASSTSGYWWSRIRRSVNLDSTHTYSLYYASGSLENPSVDDWVLCSGTVTGGDYDGVCSWTVPNASGLAEDCIQLSLVSSANSWGLSKLRVQASDGYLPDAPIIIDFDISSGYYSFDRSNYTTYDASAERTDYTIVDRMAGFIGGLT